MLQHGIGSVPPIFWGVWLCQCFLFLMWFRRRRARSRSYVDAWRKRLSEDEVAFLEGCRIDPSGPEGRLALKIRQVIAELARVPVATIHADDRFRDGIYGLPYWKSLDELHFMITLEQRAGFKIRRPIGEFVYAGHQSPEYRVRDFLADILKDLAAQKKANTPMDLDEF